ncbi:DinB family protein [Virgibacillus sp. FSP13]
MKSKQIRLHFQKLEAQRTAFFRDSNLNFADSWTRPLPEKWSIGETLYHLLLMARLFRRFSLVYIPVMLPLAHLRKKKAYKIEIHDIYQEYRLKKKRAMNAPFLIKPPADLEEKWNVEEIKSFLEQETDRLMDILNNIDQDVAGQIYYPDPIAAYPNLIQCIHLLAIHEQHHFTITKKYYR